MIFKENSLRMREKLFFCRDFSNKKPANKRVSLLTLKRDYLAGIAFKIAVNNCQY